MFRTMMKSKIHRATVTQADLHYVGSLTLARDLMEAADLYAGERVDIVDINNGTRLSTYVIEGPPHTGVVGINGAAARLISPGDLVIIIAYGTYSDQELESLRPRVVLVDDRNRVSDLGSDPAQAIPGTATMRGDLVALH
ncbi:aspartate 1-decarboxylase [Plantactinospora sp. KBS50]|uniref:aspartate 1-decarboxylase n=1 Tax=Plantactinospora sp. KBS50 TaxID=2024580 RepID=UPI000BAAA620|nr:aspartate 1-decarboxylase [Plantactinospora sp. KBS50]ASW55655.1 aspartate 1-decarboxylase [Plantactinospora sp. KBS50]